MDRLKRSLRDSLRRKQYVPATSRPRQWQLDDAAVKNNICSFHVKYLGCVQVYESRGMQVCEDALHLLKSQRRRPIRSVLFISGDGLRVVDDETKDLLVDQTIEKVSFCAPDRTNERGFSYISRDGTTRRWMCHGFTATRDSGPDQLVTGERLSHAVGCAFAICLERKQKRESECCITMSVDPSNSSFTRLGSFRQASITDRLTDPQECKPTEPVPVKPVTNPFAVERPHAPVSMFERQGSLRVHGRLVEVSPFKRQSSLRIEELPSTLERQARGSAPAEVPDDEWAPLARDRLMSLPATCPTGENASWQVAAPQRRQMSLASGSLFDMAPIAEVPATAEQEEGDNVTLLCRELTQGLDLLTGSQQETPQPDEWLDSLANTSATTAAANRHGRSRSLAADCVLSSGLMQSSTCGRPWDAATAGPPPPAGSATNPFIGGTTVNTFQLQM